MDVGALISRRLSVDLNTYIYSSPHREQHSLYLRDAIAVLVSTVSFELATNANGLRRSHTHRHRPTDQHTGCDRRRARRVKVNCPQAIKCDRVAADKIIELICVWLALLWRHSVLCVHYCVAREIICTRGLSVPLIKPIDDRSVLQKDYYDIFKDCKRNR